MSRKKDKGFLIAIEGIDGAGKSTLQKNLGTALAEEGYNLLLTREPGQTELGKSIRTLLHDKKSAISAKAEYLLFASDRAEHTEKVLLPAFEEAKIIISDRMGDSSIAYQGFGRGLDIAMIKSINNWATGGLSPDLVIYIKINARVAFERIYKRKKALTSFEKESIDFWSRVIKGFEEIFHHRNNVITLDGTLSEEEISLEAKNRVLKFLKQ